MQTSPANPMALAASLAAQVASMVHGYRHSQEMSKLQAGAMHDMVEAVVTRRVEAVQAQCHAVLTLYADQARSYLEEKKSFGDRLLDTRDVVTRLQLQSRLTEVDTRLAEIRADAKLLFDRMGELVLAIGGKGFRPPGSDAVTLDLPQT